MRPSTIRFKGGGSDELVDNVIGFDIGGRYDLYGVEIDGSKR